MQRHHGPRETLLARADREGYRAEAAVTPQWVSLTEEGRRVGLWRYTRETVGGRDWLRLALTAPDGARGEAWTPYAEPVCEALEQFLQTVSGNGHAPAANASPHGELEPRVPVHALSRERRLAHGLVASAQAELRSQRHAVPLHLWMGGAIRQEVRVTLPIVLQEATRARRTVELEREGARAAEAAATLDVTSFALHDASTDVPLIARSVAAIREALGPGPAILLRLAGQLASDQARALAAGIRTCDVIAVADPCATVAMSVEATRDQLPALGLSASRYTRETLLTCLAAAPPALLLIDPLLEGGPVAVRHLGAIARVLHVDVSLTAEAGGRWLVNLCTELAAVVPASHQPIELPPGWNVDRLRVLGVRAGALRPAATPPGDPAADTRAAASVLDDRCDSGDTLASRLK